MVGLTSGVFEDSRNVASLEHRIVSEDFIWCRAGGKQVEHILDTDTQRPNARPSATLSRVDGYAVQLAQVVSLAFGMNRIGGGYHMLWDNAERSAK
jgi:hypothetical protein